MENLVTIIIPIYNAEKYLSKTLESVLNQTYKNLEIILINDGSTDNSKEICTKFANEDKRIIFIDKENGGPSEARNKGLEISKGEYIAFVDSDDYLELNYIERLLETLKDKGVQCVLCGYNRVYDQKAEKIVREESIYLNKEEFLSSILTVQGGLGFTWGKLWKREEIQNIRFNKDIKIGEDALFCMEACKNIDKVFILNEALYNYKFNPNSIVRSYDSEYVNRILTSTKKAKEYIEKEYKDNERILKKINNYIAYHVLLISVNYCFNKKNNLSLVGQIKKLKEICNIKEFKEAIKNSNYDGLSLTRKITLFTIKYRLYLCTMIIAKIRQIQFKQ